MLRGVFNLENTQRLAISKHFIQSFHPYSIIWFWCSLWITFILVSRCIVFGLVTPGVFLGPASLKCCLILNSNRICPFGHLRVPSLSTSLSIPVWTPSAWVKSLNAYSRAPAASSSLENGYSTIYYPSSYGPCYTVACKWHRAFLSCQRQRLPAHLGLFRDAKPTPWTLEHLHVHVGTIIVPATAFKSPQTPQIPDSPIDYVKRYSSRLLPQTVRLFQKHLAMSANSLDSPRFINSSRQTNLPSSIFMPTGALLPCHCSSLLQTSWRTCYGESDCFCQSQYWPLQRCC